MSPLAVVVLVVLVDLLGFTVVMPLLAPFAREFHLAGWQIGLLFSAYPLCQLVAGPILGRLSDRHGRRPILILSQAGTALSFVMMGFAGDFTTLLLARMLDGASGGNILVAQAYVADVTTLENRSRGLGLIGMAFGLGFVLGPLLGGLILTLPIDPYWRLRVPFLVGALFSILALVLVFFRLPESLPKDVSRRSATRVFSIHGLVEAATHPTIGLLILLGFLAILGFASLEGTFSLYLRDRLGFDASQAAFCFAFLGLISATVQGGLIRRLVPKYGEAGLFLTGFTSLVVGMTGLALARNAPAMLAAIVFVAVGQGLVNPTISGLLSKVTPANEQGGIFGILSSSQTLARMISYTTANLLLAQVGPSAPFWQGSAVLAVGLVLAIFVTRRLNRDVEPSLQSANAEALVA